MHALKSQVKSVSKLEHVEQVDLSLWHFCSTGVQRCCDSVTFRRLYWDCLSVTLRDPVGRRHCTVFF